MGKMLHKTGLLFFSCIISFSAFAMRDVSSKLPSQADDETQELARTYRRLCYSYNIDEPISNFSKAYEEFEDAIFFPVDQRSSNPDDKSSYDPSVFLSRSRKTLNKIQEEIDHPTSQMLSTLLQKNIVPLLTNRIDLARLDKNLFQRLGIRGSIDNFTSEVYLRKALGCLTGRLFQIDISTNDLLSASSAIMIHWNKKRQQISNLNNQGNLSLNSILTCAHALNSNEGRSNFYFVQSVNLDLTTGFPLEINELDGTEGLINFLQTSASSFRIGDFTIKNRVSNVFTNINLSMGQPQYFSTEDLIIGNIYLKVPQILRSYNVNYKVLFTNNPPVRKQSYFALGYPSCDHYYLNAPTQLIQDTGLSPLFITQNIHTKALPVVINPNGTIIHRAPAAEGMSGGPLFYLNSGGLNIFGVITQGNDDEERGCHWF